MAWPAHALGASLATATTLVLVVLLVLDAWFVRRFVRRLGGSRTRTPATARIAVPASRTLRHT